MAYLIMAICEILLAIGIILFWVYFLKVERKKPENSEVYLAFEGSFPLPDLGWVCPLLCISAIGLLLDEWFGIFFTIVAGGALVFLGLIDISYNLQHGGYTTKLSQTIQNLAINLLCLIFGIICIVFSWLSVD
ncbi:MAG TPA: hypothetical protein VMV49_02860 [Candidatus Deferrimicrobium sp.]|nr:hypothetical protein [Candidatus Deferrimicrobium sp.]